MDAGLQAARALLPGVRLDPLEALGGGQRSHVQRVRARWPGRPETTVVVKHFLRPGEGWAREAAALASLPEQAPVARLLAEGATPPVVVTSDLGAGPNVADALLGSDLATATEAVLGWAEAVSAVHRLSFGGRERFRAQLSLRAGDLPIADHTMPTVVDEAALLLEARCGDLGVSLPGAALRELRAVPRDLGAAENAALSPSDTCPENNVSTATGLALIDFEGAQWRHVAWDVAYLSVPWPSCACSWRMPADIAERALEQYRSGVESVLPYVRSTQFRHDVAAATAAWALVSTALFLPDALGADAPPADPRKVTPTRRALILHRLDRARRNEDLPAMATLAGRLRDVLADRWGDVPLGYAPAFDRPD